MVCAGGAGQEGVEILPWKVPRQSGPDVKVFFGRIDLLLDLSPIFLLKRPFQPGDVIM